MHTVQKAKKIAASDLNEWAARVVEATTGVRVPHDIVEQEIRKIAEEKSAGISDDASEPPKNAAAVALGRLGGLKGGKARAEALTAKQRSKIAAKAAKMRWETKEKILRLHSQSVTTNEIASKLGISVETVNKAKQALKKGR